jgi:hypothetical protein
MSPNYNRSGVNPHTVKVIFPVSSQIQALIDTGQFDPVASKLIDQVIADIEKLREEKNND